MTPANTIPRIAVRPTGNFKVFANEEIEQSIPQRFEQQVRAYGDRVAIKSARQTVTFASLNRTANRLAREILSRRNEPAEPIALLFDHGAAVLVAIIAVLKTGKFYLVLDAGYPPDRLQSMLQDSGARLVVTDPDNFAFARELCGETIGVINFAEVKLDLPDDLPQAVTRII